MLFLSVERSPEWVIKPGRFAIVETSMGPMADLHRGLRVKFHELDSFLETNLLPAKRGRRVARGRIETAEEAARLGIDEPTLIEFLTSRPEYGVDFIGVNPDGDEEADDDDAFMIPVGDEYLCKLCERTFKAQGRSGHVRSKLHQAALKARNEEARADMEDLEADANQITEDPLARSMKMAEVQHP